MDEAARCGRVGFVRQGRMLVEGAPADLRARLDGRILELRGQPLPLLRHVARAAEGVEDAQMFGDRLHLRVRPGKLQEVIPQLESRISQAGGEISLVRAVPAGLEDVFIALLEDE
jgi:ABC-2 type transport system ATP-binding protein